MTGQSIVPTDEIPGTVDTAESGLAGNVQRSITASSVREHQRMVSTSEFLHRDGTAHPNIAHEEEPRILCDLIKLVLDGLDAGEGGEVE